MSDREQIFEKIRQALDPLPERTAYPQWDTAVTVSRFAEEADSVELFKRRFVAAKGLLFEDVVALRDYLVAEGHRVAYVDAQARPFLEGALDALVVEEHFARERVDQYDVGMTIVSGAIAESGTVVIRDADDPYRLGALAPWTHVAVVRRVDICHTIAESIERLGPDPSIIYVTGPSKTADIEGILIQGVHGPGVQAVLLV